jgi:hypothetical protein
VNISLRFAFAFPFKMLSPPQTFEVVKIRQNSSEGLSCLFPAVIVMDSFASDRVEMSALDGRVARVLIQLIAFIHRLSIFVPHRRWVVGFVSKVMLFPNKAPIRGEEIGEIGSMLSQAALMS